MNEKDVLDSIAKRLVFLRKKAGYKSYETFAFDKGIARQQYWRLERGENFTIKSLLKVLDAHSITIEDFFKIDPDGEVK